MSNQTIKRSALSPAASPRVPVWLAGVLLVAITIALYWPVRGHDFIYFDDDSYVLDNPHVLGGLTWHSAMWALENSYVCNWHPLTWMSHMLDCQMFGVNPRGHHLVNVLWHAVDTLLVFLLLRRLTGAFWRSALVAALFAWHPVNVECVAWVAERKSVLSTFFGLLTLFFYTGYARANPQTGETARSLSALVSYWLAWFCLLLGVMSKSILVTWPFVFLLLDYWPLHRWEKSSVWRLLWEKIPFFALALATSVVTFFVHKDGGDMVSVQTLPLSERIANAVISYGRYLEKLLWPTHLALFYPLPGHSPGADVALAGLCLGALTLLFLALRRRYPFLLMGWLWFGGTLVPVIGLVQVGSQAMADRHAYIPCLGIFIIFAWALQALTQAWRCPRFLFTNVGVVALLLCFSVTRRELGYWQDTESLSREAIAVTQGNYVAHDLLGNVYIRQGQTNAAVGEFQEALQINPHYAYAHANLGSVLFDQGDTVTAINEFHDAIECQPGYEPSYYNMGVALTKIGHGDEAMDFFQKALRLQSDDANAHNDLGNLLVKKGQMDAAAQQFQAALSAKPDYAQAHNQLGAIWFNKGHVDAAINEYRAAIQYKPDYGEAHNNLGTALASQGQTPEAIIHFQDAARFDPGNASVHDNWGIALASAGQTNAAVDQFQEALHLWPADPEAASDLGYLWVKQGEHLDEARGLIALAVKSDPRNSDYLGSLGWVLLKLNRPGEGLNYMLQAVAHCDPPDAELYEHLGDTYAALNERALAAAAWRKSLLLKSNPPIQKKLDEISVP